MDEDGLSRDGAQQALWSVDATLGSRFARLRHNGFAVGLYDDAGLELRLSATRRVRISAIGGMTGSRSGHRRRSGFAFRPYNDSGFVSRPSATFWVRTLSIGGFPGSGFVHSGISGSDIVHLELFLAFRWTKDEPKIGGRPKSEPGIGGWPKTEPNMPCRAGWSMLMDKCRTQHACRAGWCTLMAKCRTQATPIGREMRTGCVDGSKTNPETAPPRNPLYAAAVAPARRRFPCAEGPEATTPMAMPLCRNGSAVMRWHHGAVSCARRSRH